MSLDFHFDRKQNRLAVSGELTIYHAAAAKQSLLERPGADLDLSAVTQLDGAGLQLLLLARRDAAMRLGAASEPVVEVLRLTGLEDLLETRA